MDVLPRLVYDRFPLIATSSAADIKLGILSDIHLKLDYDPVSSENYCKGPDSIKFLQEI